MSSAAREHRRVDRGESSSGGKEATADSSKKRAIEVDLSETCAPARLFSLLRLRLHPPQTPAGLTSGLPLPHPRAPRPAERLTACLAAEEAPLNYHPTRRQDALP